MSKYSVPSLYSLILIPVCTVHSCSGYEFSPCIRFPNCLVRKQFLFNIPTFLFSDMQSVAAHSYLTGGSGWGERVVVAPVWTAPRPERHFSASSTGSIRLWCWRATCSPTPPGHQEEGDRRGGGAKYCCCKITVKSPWSHFVVAASKSVRFLIEITKNMDVFFLI